MLVVSVKDQSSILECYGSNFKRNELERLRRWNLNSSSDTDDFKSKTLAIKGRLNEQHKCQEQQQQRLSSYHDGIVQMGIWLDMMEKSVANDQGQQAVTLPEIRSHLMKHKAHIQDVQSHKRQVRITQIQWMDRNEMDATVSFSSISNWF